MDLTQLRLKRKGQLSELDATRRNLVAKADNNLVVILGKADTIPDAGQLDTTGILAAAKELHENATAIRALDENITKIRKELFPDG